MARRPLAASEIGEKRVSDNGKPEFKERHFIEVLEKTGLVPRGRIDYAIAFQAKALEKKGRRIPIDEILVKLGDLDREGRDKILDRLSYGLARKEDKWYCRIAVKSKFVSASRSRDVLAEQKRLHKAGARVRRVNLLLFEKGLIDGQKDRLIVEAMRDKKPQTKLRSLAEEGLDGRGESKSALEADVRDSSRWPFRAESSDALGGSSSIKREAFWGGEKHLGERKRDERPRGDRLRDEESFDQPPPTSSELDRFDSDEEWELKPAGDDLA